uniref:Cyclin-like domain-containing protein n=1 Tax=Ditylum brightwellii TaxID=49249 RepID=A0A7S4QQU5_9STRA
MSDTHCEMMNEEIISQLEAMRRQESGAYACRDYFSQQRSESTECDFGMMKPMRTRWQQQQSTPLCPASRRKMIEWCYQIVDQCGFDRESVVIAISYLDRFLMTQSGVPALHNNKTFQLVTMTCLYIAIKLFEPEVIDPSIVSHISRGLYTEQDIVDMEMVILSALQWRVQPPTAIAFVRHFLALVDLEERTKSQIVDASRIQIEKAVSNYEFIGINPSMIAAASILNTVHFMDRKLLPVSCQYSLSLVLERYGSNRNIYGGKMREVMVKLLSTIIDKQVPVEQQDTVCKVTVPTASKSAQEDRAFSPWSPISIEKGPSDFISSVSDALHAGSQIWS